MDVPNQFLVSVSRDKILMLNPPRGPISQDDAIILAAWLVAMANNASISFADALEAVENT